MISPNRIAEIIAQCKTQKIRREEGELDAYMSFAMSNGDVSTIDSEIMVAESEIEKSESQSDWEFAMGKKIGYLNLKEQVAKHGE